MSRAAGGIFEIERRLAQCLQQMPDTAVSVYGLRDEHTEADLAAWRPLEPKTFPVRGLRGFGYAPGFSEALHSGSPDLAHLHALWMYPSVAIHRWSRRTVRPYVVTPNGMLEPWALRNSVWKKRIASLLYERRMLEGAACLQANTEKEAADFRAFGLKNPIAIIPNGIDLPTESREQKVENRNEFQLSAFPISAFPRGRNVLLYLGRLHPKKGLANLLGAWKSVVISQSSSGPASDWLLALAGWDQGGHETELKQLATELGIGWEDSRRQRKEGGAQRADNSQLSTFNLQPSTSLLFTGPLFGREKEAAYRHCDAFILPSFSEGLPMVILEAWAYGKPVLMTPECNLPEGFAANAALRIETNPESIARGLHELFEAARAPAISPLRLDRGESDATLAHPMGEGLGVRASGEVSSSRVEPSTFNPQPSTLLARMGANGRSLVAARFTWPTVAAEMKSVYDWVLGGGSPPECVRLR